MFQKIKRILGVALLVVFLATLVYLLVIRITGETPSIFGFSFLRVSSDSMEPEINVGEIILVKKVDPATLEKGDVIAYKGEKGNLKGLLVTHQISKEPYEKDGVFYFTTRGVKEGAVDDPEINDSQIRGEVLYKIPFLGTVYDFFTEWYGFVAFIALILIAFSSEIINLIKLLRERDEEENEPVHTNLEDIRQSESIEVAREQEFEGIITDLDDPDL